MTRVLRVDIPVGETKAYVVASHGARPVVNPFVDPQSRSSGSLLGIVVVGAYAGCDRGGMTTGGRTP